MMAGYATLRMTESRVETPWALAFANGTRDSVWLWFCARYMTGRDAQMLRSREFLAAYPAATVVAFEANDETLPQCRAAAAELSPRLRLVEGAVCDTDGEVEFFAIDTAAMVAEQRTTWADGNPGASSLFRALEGYPHERYVQRAATRVPAHRLDSLIAAGAIPEADVVWMDIQGAELAALHSLGSHMAGVQHIFTEVSHRDMYAGGCTFAQLDAFARGAGFVRRDDVFPLRLDAWQQDVIYSRPADAPCADTPREEAPSSEPPPCFDAVVPLHEKDAWLLPHVLGGLRGCAVGLRHVYVVSAAAPAALAAHGATWIDERAAFPFSLDDVRAALPPAAALRAGWYFQQLVKLHAAEGIPGLTQRYLVMDADTVLLSPVEFVDGAASLFATTSEAHAPYFAHMARLGPFQRAVPASGIAHHMLFDTAVLRELKMRAYGEGPFWRKFLAAVDPAEAAASGASEYELYWHYVLAHHPTTTRLRPLRRADTATMDGVPDDVQIASIHSYMVQ